MTNDERRAHDLIIVGAGPAGITAAVYAARKRMDFVMLSLDVGGQVAISSEIENYTGYQFVTGPELSGKFREHAEKYGIEVKEGQEVNSLSASGDEFEISAGDENWRGSSVIVASGAKPKELGVKGEGEFKYRGVTYCATCDAPLYPDKKVAVIGGGNSGLEAALQLAKIASEVHLVEMQEQLTGDAVMIEKVQADLKVTVHTGTKLAEISGGDFVTGARLVGPGGEKELALDGVFVEIGYTPNSGFVQGVEKTRWGEIKVDGRCATSLPGLFAAGDVTDVYAKQIVTACGEGCKALLAAFEYLSRKK